MRKEYFAAAAANLFITSSSGAIPPSPADYAMEAYQSDEIAWDITEGLSTEIGPRMPGTEAEARARDWALVRLRSLGLKNVRSEEFSMPTWVRGAEKASVISPFPQKLVITALGNSGSTGPKGISGEVAYFASFNDLLNAPANRVKNKIAFVDNYMQPTQDGSHYRFAGTARFHGPAVAAQKGAAAILVRSIGTSDDRVSHTGNTSFPPNVSPIPSAALTVPDANNLRRMLLTPRSVDGKPRAYHPIRLWLKLTPRFVGHQTSGNVIAEIPGRDPSLPLILVACHIDSWDLGTGAIDNASGCGIVKSAALNASRARRPLRTIRILWAGAEEVGVWGGASYSEKNRNVPHALAMESDFGADKVWRAEYRLHESAKPLQHRINSKLARFGIAPSDIRAGGGADIGPIIVSQKLAVIDLQQDGTRYFDLHHNANDTLDKVDKKQLRQNVAAWTTVLEEVANYAGRLKP